MTAYAHADRKAETNKLAYTIVAMPAVYLFRGSRQTLFCVNDLLRQYTALVNKVISYVSSAHL